MTQPRGGVFCEHLRAKSSWLTFSLPVYPSITVEGGLHFVYPLLLPLSASRGIHDPHVVQLFVVPLRSFRSF